MNVPLMCGFMFKHKNMFYANSAKHVEGGWTGEGKPVRVKVERIYTVPL